MKNFLNIISQFLAYTPTNGTTDNPTQRNFDWRRQISSIVVENPISEPRIIPAMATQEIFSGFRSHTLTTSDTTTLTLKDSESCIYRLTASSEAFRTARTLANISSCIVTVNNNAIAVFDFQAMTHNAQVGDILRVKGYNLGDANTAWNPINTGLFTIVAISGSKFHCVRPQGQTFEATQETVTITSNDFEIYSAAGVQKGDKISFNAYATLDGKQFEVLDATPTLIDFCSAEPLATDIEYPYAVNDIQFLIKGKNFVYVEADQEVVLRFNGDTSNSIVVSPIKAGDPQFVGFFSKWGPAYQLSVVNRSINPCNIRIFTAE